MISIMKFDIEKFDGKINFSIWRVQLMVVLIHATWVEEGPWWKVKHASYYDR